MAGVVAILETGAYQESSASNFNSSPRPATVLVGTMTRRSSKRTESLTRTSTATTSSPERFRAAPHPREGEENGNQQRRHLGRRRPAGARGPGLFHVLDPSLNQSSQQDWLPAGYREHESPFVFSDMMLALLLLATAVLLVLEEPMGEHLALVAGGMLVFLGVLDTAYFSNTGMFAPEHEGYMNLAGVVAASLAGGILPDRPVQSSRADWRGEHHGPLP